MALDWVEVAKVSVPAVAVAASFLTPLGDEFFVRAMRRRKDSVRALVKELFSDEMKANALARQRTEANHDAIEFIKASLLAQGEELPKVSIAVREMTVAVRQLTTAVEEVERTADAARLSNIRLDERMAAWERQRAEDRERYRGEPRRASDKL